MSSRPATATPCRTVPSENTKRRSRPPRPERGFGNRLVGLSGCRASYRRWCGTTIGRRRWGSDMRNSGSVFEAVLLALGLAVAGGVTQANATCPTAGLPPQVTCGTRDPSAATAGTYAIDGNHAAVIARVSHLDYSRSVFRFDRVKGTLAWNPAAPAKSKLSVTVQTASIDTNVAGFATELAGDGFLKSKAFPEATFVSTAFRRTSPAHG